MAVEASQRFLGARTWRGRLLPSMPFAFDDLRMSVDRFIVGPRVFERALSASPLGSAMAVRATRSGERKLAARGRKKDFPHELAKMKGERSRKARAGLRGSGR